MLYILAQKLIGRLRSQSAVSIITLVLIMFCTSWPLMWWFERGSTDIASPSNYWWFFDVSLKTIGYGDKTPTTTGGRVVASVTTWITIPLGIALLSKVAIAVFEGARKMRIGLAQLRLTGHIVIVGYHASRTEQIIRLIRRTCTLPIVVVAANEQVPENPFPTTEAAFRNVYFVRGRLETPDVYQRACLDPRNRPFGVILDGSPLNDDNRTQSALIALRRLNTEVHVVATLSDPTNAELLQLTSATDTEVECVLGNDPAFAARGILYPGASEVLTEIAQPTTEAGDTADLLSVQVPAGARELTVQEIILWFLRHKATVVAFQIVSDGQRRRIYNHDPGATVEPGTTVFYLAGQELSESPW